MKNHITVIDSHVGSGKSSWAIDFMNNLPDDQRFIFITPLLDEIDRIQKGCDKKVVVAPKPHSAEYNTKSKAFKKLIEQNKNIASTHALFLQIDKEVIDLLRSKSYILILDEVFNVVAKYNYFSDFKVSSAEEDKKEIFASSDIHSLENLGYLSFDDEGKISWIKDDNPLSRYSDIEKLAKNEQLYFINEKLLWIFPKVVFSEGIFQEIFILTFQFRFQLQYYYFEYFKIGYQVRHIKETGVRKYVLEVSDGYETEIEWVKGIYFRDLIDIDDGDRKYENAIKNVGDTKYYLSNNWFGKTENSKLIFLLYLSARSFFVANRTTKSQRMWTCFKRDKKYFKDPKQKKIDGSQKDCPYLSPRKKFWVPCSTRATNELGKKTHIAYLVNRFPPPEYSHFFSKRKIKINEDGFALSEMIQFIWRSAIRNNEKIVIYMPSGRMKGLLKNYLNGKHFGLEFPPPPPPDYELILKKAFLFLSRVE